MVAPDRLADWRIGISGEVASGEGPIPKGEIVLFPTEVATPGGGSVRFPFPSPVRLALNVAVGAARAARSRLDHADFLRKPGSKDLAIDPDTLGFTYDLIEECMLAAITSFQAIEAYANDVIGRRLRNRSLEVTRRSGPVSLSSEGIQRRLSTEEKLLLVLPQVLNTRLSKSTRLWRQFKALAKVRDDLIHVKSHETALRGGAVDRDSVFFRLLNNDPTEYPRTAIAVMLHFAEYNTKEMTDHVEGMLDTGKPGS